MTNVRSVPGTPLIKGLELVLVPSEALEELKSFNSARNEFPKMLSRHPLMAALGVSSINAYRTKIDPTDNTCVASEANADALHAEYVAPRLALDRLSKVYRAVLVDRFPDGRGPPVTYENAEANLDKFSQAWADLRVAFTGSTQICPVQKWNTGPTPDDPNLYLSPKFLGVSILPIETGE
jgi:hypothetical protein